MACSPELQSLWKHFHDLQRSICNPEQLAVEASAVNLIPTVVKEQICNHGGTVAEKTRLLILRIEQEVASNPVALHFFLAIISKHSSFAECAGKLRTSLGMAFIRLCCNRLYITKVFTHVNMMFTLQQQVPTIGELTSDLRDSKGSRL